jgi:predicted DNA-binding protein
MGRENSDKEMQIRMPPSLYERFKTICDGRYKSVSAVVKELMVKFVEDNERLPPEQHEKTKR